MTVKKNSGMDKMGLTKMIEECGELIQIAAKKQAFMDTDDHPDGKGSMKLRLEKRLRMSWQPPVMWSTNSG